jgi:hypothetical protein
MFKIKRNGRYVPSSFPKTESKSQMSSSLLFLQHFELHFSDHHTTHSEFLLKTRTANPLYVLDFPLSQPNLNLYDLDVSRPLLPSKTYYLTPDVSPLLHLKIEMAYDDVFPFLARPPKNDFCRVNGSLSLFQKLQLHNDCLLPPLF